MKTYTLKQIISEKNKFMVYGIPPDIAHNMEKVFAIYSALEDFIKYIERNEQEVKQ